MITCKKNVEIMEQEKNRYIEMQKNYDTDKAIKRFFNFCFLHEILIILKKDWKTDNETIVDYRRKTRRICEGRNRC